MPILPMPLRAVICDMDGLLLDSEAAHKTAMRQAAEELGYSLPDALIMRTVGVHRPQNRITVQEAMGHDFPIDSFYSRADELFEQVVLRGLPHRPGVSQLLDLLDKLQIRKAVVTSTATPWAEERLRSAGIEHRFDVVVTLSQVTVPKPAPDPYLQALARLRLAADEALALEDSHNGVRSAAAAGLATIMVPDLLPPTEETRGLTIATVGSLNDVAELIRRETELSGLRRPLAR